MQNQKSINIESSKVESNVEKNQTIYHFETLEEAQKFMEQCTDVTIATQVVDGERVVVSSCESTYPCVSGGTSVFVINL